MEHERNGNGDDRDFDYVVAFLHHCAARKKDLESFRSISYPRKGQDDLLTRAVTSMRQRLNVCGPDDEAWLAPAFLGSADSQMLELKV